MPNFSKLSSVAWLVVFAALILRLTTIYFDMFRNAEPPESDIDKWMAGSFPRPYATRVLVPCIVVSASAITPAMVRKSVESGSVRLPIPDLPARLQPQILGVIVILCYAGYAVVMRKFILAIFGEKKIRANLITAGSLYLMPVMFRYHNYSYDPATILLSTLLWYLMYTKRWTAFFGVFILACMNKETAVLFVLSAALWQSLKGGFALRYIVLLLAAGLFTRIGISLLTARFPGSYVEFHLLDHNLGHIFPNADMLDLVSILFVGFLVFSFWSEKPLLLSIGIVQLALMVASAIFVGYLDEYRLYFDCFPILVLTISYSLVRLGGGSFSAEPTVEQIQSTA
jgi:hypothetical protein